jgi:sporulation protein YlmC with PRC-barrel domain
VYHNAQIEEVAVQENTALMIGSLAKGTDGICGRVTQVVLDPIADTVTHVIVEPEHREGLGRLVPVDWVAADGAEVRLTCSQAEFDRLERAEITQFLPGLDGYPDLSPEQMLVWPLYGGNISLPVTYDTLPAEEVAVRRGEHVHALDGEIGQIDGLVVAASNHHVTHVLLQEGHLFGHKVVAIPINAVTKVAQDDIRLSLSKSEVASLPAVDLASTTS